MGKSLPLPEPQLVSSWVMGVFTVRMPRGPVCLPPSTTCPCNGLPGQWGGVLHLRRAGSSSPHHPSGTSVPEVSLGAPAGLCLPSSLLGACSTASKGDPPGKACFLASCQLPMKDPLGSGTSPATPPPPPQLAPGSTCLLSCIHSPFCSGSPAVRGLGSPLGRCL